MEHLKNLLEESMKDFGIFSIVVPIVVILVSGYLFSKRYYFKPEELGKMFVEVGKMEIPIEQKVEILIKKLAEKYPGKTTKHPEWFLNYAGGILCPILVLHCRYFWSFKKKTRNHFTIFLVIGNIF